MAVADVLGSIANSDNDGDEVPSAPPMEEHKEHDPASYEHLKDAISHMKKGSLHKELGVPVGDVIPKEKLEAAAHSSNHLLARRARFALTMEGWRHGHHGKHDAEFHSEK